MIIFRAEQSQRDKEKLEQAEAKIATLQKDSELVKNATEKICHLLDEKEEMTASMQNLSGQAQAGEEGDVSPIG